MSRILNAATRHPLWEVSKIIKRLFLQGPSCLLIREISKCMQVLLLAISLSMIWECLNYNLIKLIQELLLKIFQLTLSLKRNWSKPLIKFKTKSSLLQISIKHHFQMELHNLAVLQTVKWDNKVLFLKIWALFLNLIQRFQQAKSNTDLAEKLECS